ncbi:MAG: efflux RND transporter periplasmic adaptor subunit [gamma proteobacterium symbiont of Bathyaustriella thionipta]|nr:efflux RND transporter periplasmic adaptor subunit [gamma proteobacterium symbiont of Bathyaustriella thionipta]
MLKKIRVVALAAVIPFFAGVAQAANTGFDTFTVTTRTSSVQISLGGTVVPFKEVTLSAQIPGRVKYIAGLEGESFDSGTLLVAIDDTELLAKRRAAEAEYSNADAALRNAGVQYSRELYSPRSRSSPGGMGTPNLFDQMFSDPMSDMMGRSDKSVERSADIYSSRTQIDKARNALSAASSQIQAIDAKLRDARSVAPFDGVIVTKFIEEGDTVQPGMPLLKFADMRYLQIVVEVPARLRPGLSQGQILRAVLDVGELSVPVRVAQIFPLADPQRHTVKVKLDLPIGTNASPGMYARVGVPDPNADSAALPIIPKTAVRYRGSLPAVYVVNSSNKPELRLIRVGELIDGDHYTVLSGLSNGDTVLRNPPVTVTAGWSHSTE